MIRKTLRALAWLVGSALVVVVALWAVIVAINWRDRAPSEAAMHLANAYRERPAIRDEDNAFIYVMGFVVGPDERPFDMGLQRVAWMQKTPVNSREDPLGDPRDTRSGRDPAIGEFIAACDPEGRGCAAAFSAAEDVFERWMGSEAWLLERYQTLIALPGWRETVPLDVSAPLPAYSLVMDGQRLLLLNAHMQARRGDLEAVKDLLARDSRFWREVLESSDILITKMIATAALDRHFQLGNLVLRELPPEKGALAMPVEWMTPLSDSERSLFRCISGELVFSAALLRQHPPSPRWIVPLYKAQATINEVAALYAEASATLDAPLHDYIAALGRASAATERWRQEVQDWRSPYNIAGRLIIAPSATDFGSYARRVNDLEGVRRAALSAVTLRGKRVKAEDVSAALAALPYRNPYDDQPLAWDAAGKAILFTGLERAPRGQHRIDY